MTSARPALDVQGQVTVVVPAFNNWHLTKRCLDSLLEFGAAAGVGEIIVVDNASTDGTQAGLRSYPTVRSILHERNLGFAHACNAGARAARCPLVFLFNNDAFAIDDSMRHMIEALEDPGVGQVGARLIYEDGTLQHAGMVWSGDGRWLHIHRFLEADYADANEPRDYPAVTGAAVLVRKDLFLELGGYDAGYRNGYEDVDFAMRLWNTGYRVRYEPRAVFVHLESASAGRFDDDIANFQKFHGRWRVALDRLPRYPYRWSIGIVAGAAGPIEKTSFGGDTAYEFYEGLKRNGCYAIPVGGTDDLQPCATVTWNAVLGERVGGLPSIVFAMPANDAVAVAYRSKADHFLVPSRMAERMLENAGVPAGHVDLAYVGADFGVFNPSVPGYAFPKKAVLALGVQAVSDDYIAATVQTYTAAQRPDAMLVFVTDERSPNLQERISRVCAERRIVEPPLQIMKIQGVIGAIFPQLLRGAACYMAPEAPDQDLRTVFAALASETPVVSRNVPPLDEILDGGEIPAVNGEFGLAEDLRRVLDDPQGARAKAHTARLRAERRFGTTMCGARAADAIRRALFGTTGGSGFTVTATMAQELAAAGTASKPA